LFKNVNTEVSAAGKVAPSVRGISGLSIWTTQRSGCLPGPFLLQSALQAGVRGKSHHPNPSWGLLGMAEQGLGHAGLKV